MTPERLAEIRHAVKHKIDNYQVIAEVLDLRDEAQQKVDAIDAAVRWAEANKAPWVSAQDLRRILGGEAP